MKLQKVLCPLLAGAMLCTSFAALPASAVTSEYELGDVNMNGKIDPEDCVLALRDYTRVVLLSDENSTREQAIAEYSILTDEQRYLADVFTSDSDCRNPYFVYYELNSMDAAVILQYYVYESICNGEPIGITAYWENSEKYLDTVQDVDFVTEVQPDLEDALYSSQVN